MRLNRHVLPTLNISIASVDSEEEGRDTSELSMTSDVWFSIGLDHRELADGATNNIILKHYTMDGNIMSGQLNLPEYWCL